MKNFPHKKVLLVGVGGIGISALARLLISKGVQVFGINDSESPETLSDIAEKINLQIYRGEATKMDLPDEIEAIVYSTAWEGRAPEFISFLEKLNLPMYSYAQALGLVSRDYKTVAVSGTHGKTTTTAMLSFALEQAGIKHNTIVGSLVDWKDGTKSNFKDGAGSDILVIEACEYKRHFLNFRPFLSLITNVEYDHPDYYKSLDDVKEAFAQFQKQSKHVIYSTDTVVQDIKKLLPELSVLGEHNRENAALAVAGAVFLGADKEKAIEGVANFKGAWRRIEYKGKNNKGALVFDDYAHHPTEIKATLSAVRKANPHGRVYAVFEPHMYSRTAELFDEFAHAFELADEVYLAPIYPAREAPIEGITSESLSLAVSKTGKKVTALPWESLVSELKNKGGKGDIILCMGAGEMFKLAQDIAN